MPSTVPWKRIAALLSVCIIMIVTVLVVFGAYRTLMPKNVAQYLRNVGVVNQTLNEFVITDVRTYKLSDLSVTDMSFQKDGVIVHLVLTKGMELDLAMLYKEEKEAGIRSLFLPQPAHYPGAITKEIECPAEFQPEVGTTGAMDYYTMFANERFSLGVCSPDMVKYKSVVGVGYCERQNTFIEIKTYYDPQTFSKNDALHTLSSFACM